MSKYSNNFIAWAKKNSPKKPSEKLSVVELKKSIQA
jgi:hypothetical protein